MKIEGTEYCGHCNDDFDFEVEEDVWIVPCKTCGRPTVLCDKCHTMELDTTYGGSNCGNCKHCIECDKLVKRWMKGEIGKVYWVDSSLDMVKSNNYISGWYKVVKFDKEGAYLLENIEVKGEKVRTFGEMIDYSEKYNKQ